MSCGCPAGILYWGSRGRCGTRWGCARKEGNGDGGRASGHHVSKAIVEPYDLIYSFGVIHHTPNPERVLEQMQRYARAGTTAKIMVYHRRSWKVLWILATEGRGRFWKLRELVAKNSEAQTGCPITYTYTRREGRELLERHGFRVREERVDHIFPWRIQDYVQYRYVKQPYFRWMPEGAFRGLEKWLGWHLCITAEK